MSGRFWKWAHLVGVIFFIVLWGAAWYFKWVESVVFVSHVSMVALVLAELSAWQASRTEQKQDDEIESTVEQEIDEREDVERRQ